MKSSTLYLIIAIIATTAIVGTSIGIVYLKGQGKLPEEQKQLITPSPTPTVQEEEKELESYPQAATCEVSFTLNDAECPEITKSISPNPPILGQSATFTFVSSQPLSNVTFTQSGVINCTPASSTNGTTTTTTYTCTVSENEGEVELTGYITSSQICSASIAFNVQTFTCGGEVPKNGVKCPDPQTSLTDPDISYHLIETCSDPSEWCEYVCDDDHIYEDGKCVVPTYFCTGDVPEDSEMCPGDNEGLTQDTPRVLADSCTDARKCEYICDDDHTYEDGECVPITYSCTGDVPSNATLCKDDDKNLTADTPRKLVDACTDSRKCEYICKDDYEKDDDECKVKPTPTPSPAPTSVTTAEPPAKPELPKAGGVPPTLIFTVGGVILVILGLLF